MIKRAISKNYFQWDNLDVPAVFDQRVVNQFLAENKDPVDSALPYNDTDTKILVYEDRVKTWFLDVAKYLTIKNSIVLPSGEDFDTNEAGFVILQIAISYIEGNQQYREGKSSLGKSGLFFRNGIKRIFPELKQIANADNILKEFYDQVRCGLFHDGITKPKVTISGELPNAVEILPTDIKINPYKFLERISADFEDYISRLKDKNNVQLRKNFELKWDMVG